MGTLVVALSRCGSACTWSRPSGRKIAENLCAGAQNKIGFYVDLVVSGDLGNVDDLVLGCHDLVLDLKSPEIRC